MDPPNNDLPLNPASPIIGGSSVPPFQSEIGSNIPKINESKNISSKIPKLEQSTQNSLSDINIFPITDSSQEEKSFSLADSVSAVAERVKFLISLTQRGTISNESTITGMLLDLASTDPVAVAKNIHNFDLKEQSRIDIAKCCAAHNGHFISLYIVNFGITDKKEVYKILEIAAEASGKTLTVIIQDCDPSIQAEMLKLAQSLNKKQEETQSES